MPDDRADPTPLDEIEKHQLVTTASRLESEEKHAITLTDGFVRTIITLSAAVMTFGVSASSVFKPFQFDLLLAVAWVFLFVTVILGLIVQRRCRDLVRISYTKLDTLHKQSVMARLGKHDHASRLSQDAETYRTQEEAEYKKHFFHEKWLIITFGLGLSLMTIFGVLNLSLESLRSVFFTAKSINTEWKQLITDPDGKGYGFSLEALFDTDIELPDIKMLTGKVKFINEPGSVHFGYLVTVVVEKLDSTKLPEQYRKEKKGKAKGGEFTILPPDQVVYETHFEFTFRDKDNFVIFTLKSPLENLISGKDNQFQRIIQGAIPYSIAARTSAIAFSMSIDKCVTCR